MTTRSVNMVITARDRASKNINKISRSTNRMGDIFKRVAMAGGIAIGIAGIVKGFQNIVRAASQAEEIKSKFLAVFKEEAEVAAEFGKNLGRAVNRSKTDLMGYLATLQDTFVPLGFARKEARLMSQTMTKLAIDLASFNDKADADVIRDLQSAIVGNHETVRKYGVIITQTTLNQELMNMGIEKGIKAATEQQKAQARLNVIMRGTTDAQGDAIRTADSFANQWKGLKADLKEGAITIGKFVLPSITAFIKTVRRGFTIAAVAIQNWKILSEIALKASVLNVIDYAMNIKHWFTVVIPDLLGWFFRNWKQVFIDLWNGTKAIFTNMFKNIVNFFKSVWHWLKGDEFDFTWTSLLEGFESSLQEMPKIAKRELTDIEKNLKSQIDNLRAQFKAKLKEKLQVELEAKAAITETTTPEMTTAEKEKVKAKVKAGKRGRLAAQESRFLTMAPGSTIDIERKTEKNTKNTVAVLKKIDRGIEAVEKKLAGNGSGMRLRLTNFA